MVNLTNEENFNMGKIFLNNNLLFKSLFEKSSIQNNYRIYSNNNKNICFFLSFICFQKAHCSLQISVLNLHKSVGLICSRY